MLDGEDAKALLSLKGTPGHQAMVERLKRSISPVLQVFLSSTPSDAELRRMNHEASAAYALLQLISLDDVTPEVFAQDALERIDLERKERIAQIREHERAAHAAHTM